MQGLCTFSVFRFTIYSNSCMLWYVIDSLKLHSFYVGIVASSPQSVSDGENPDPGVENGAGEKITVLFK